MNVRSNRNRMAGGVRAPRASFSRGVPLNRSSRRKEALTDALKKMSLLTSAATRSRESRPSLVRMHWDYEPTPNPSQEGSSTAFSVPLLGGVGGGFVADRLMGWANDPLPSRGERGSVLIIVIWIAFGLVSLALYFAHSMSFEVCAADTCGAGMKA